MKNKYKNVRLPKGWTLKDVEELRQYYDQQSDQEAAAEIDTAPSIDEAIVIVPRKLLSRIRKLIKEQTTPQKRRRPKSRAAA